MRLQMSKQFFRAAIVAAIVGHSCAAQAQTFGGSVITGSEVVSDVVTPAQAYVGDMQPTIIDGGASYPAPVLAPTSNCDSGDCGGCSEGGCDSGSCGSSCGEDGCSDGSCGGCADGTCGKKGCVGGVLGRLASGKLFGGGAFVGDYGPSAGCGEKKYDHSDLFYNYYSNGQCNRTNAQMYLSPGPVPHFVGHTFGTYQPFYPEEYLYWHKNKFHNDYDNGRGHNRTRALYYAPPVKTALSNIYWNKLRLPR